MRLRSAIFFLLAVFLVGEARSLLSHHKPSLIVRTTRHVKRLKCTKPDQTLVVEASEAQADKDAGIQNTGALAFSYRLDKRRFVRQNSYSSSLKIYLADISSRAPPRTA
ncbi:MAG: hypothetical protein JSR44_05205 [Spirochaetes bacterium]|nr:hypothetical protein [Spirochaetota bacterium]